MQNADTPNTSADASDDPQRPDGGQGASPGRPDSPQTQNPPPSSDLTGPGGDPAEGKP